MFYGFFVVFFFAYQTVGRVFYMCPTGIRFFGAQWDTIHSFELLRKFFDCTLWQNPLFGDCKGEFGSRRMNSLALVNLKWSPLPKSSHQGVVFRVNLWVNELNVFPSYLSFSCPDSIQKKFPPGFNLNISTHCGYILFLVLHKNRTQNNNNLLGKPLCNNCNFRSVFIFSSSLPPLPYFLV